MNQNGDKPSHGGDRLYMAKHTDVPEKDILDFSVNVRPDGPLPSLMGAITRAINDIGVYPTPHAEEAVQAASDLYGLPVSSFVFGNGTTEIIRALCLLLKKRGCPCAAIPEPAFCEYASGWELTGLPLLRQQCAIVRKPSAVRPGDTDIDFRLPADWILSLPEGCAVFFANPGNPAGSFLPRPRLEALIRKRPDLVWIIDEAFMRYAGPDRVFSAIPLLKKGVLPGNCRLAVLRSLTKFEGLAGLRLGFMAASGDLADTVRAILPGWNLNCLAQAAAKAALSSSAESLAEEKEARRQNLALRRDLMTRLRDLPLTFCRSKGNYLLVQLNEPRPALGAELLARFGIALRDCSDYHGLGGGSWYRMGVRTPEDHARLASALTKLLTPSEAPAILRKKRPALMLQGTCSNAGKSILTAAFCRILREDGFDAAPFKAQNMSLNSGVAPDGGEMGRAQILQAQAAGINPDCRMNPVLLKPSTDRGSQVIVLGRPAGFVEAKEFGSLRARLWERVTGAYASLSAEHGVMVLEGAGSPGEINLKKNDIVNMAMAREAGAKVLLAGDIDRGGLYASFLGTWLTFTPEERRLLAGFLVNRFRGDPSLLAPAHEYLGRATGAPVLGVIPYIRSLNLPEEDSLSWNGALNAPSAEPDALNVAVVILGHTSNYTDMAPLAMEPDVNLRAVRRPSEWGRPDLVIIPGSRNTALDLAKLRESGLDALIRRHAEKNGWTLGICGGMQILGEKIRDPLSVETRQKSTDGLGLLPLETDLASAKTLRRVENVATPLGVPASGYEIHHGVTRPTAEGLTFFGKEEEEGAVLGAGRGRCWGTYLHGLFDNDAFRRAFLNRVRSSLGLAPREAGLVSYDTERAISRLASIVRGHTDMDAIYRILGLKGRR